MAFAKPEIVRYDKYGVFVDGIQMERVTSISLSGDRATEDILQLSDSGIVQKIQQSPEVSLTIETNFIGSTDNLCLLTDNVFNYAVCNGTTDPRSQTIKGWQTFDRLNAGSANSWQSDHLDMLNCYVNVTIPIAYGTSVGKTMLLHRMALTGYSMALDVGGNATESFTLNCSNRYWFASAWRGVRCHLLKNAEIETTAAATSGVNQQEFPVICAAGKGIPFGASVVGMLYGRHTAFCNNTDDWTFAKGDLAAERLSWRITNKDVSDSNTYWANPFVSSPTDSGRDKAYLLWYPPGSPTYAGASTTDWGIELTHTAGTLGAVARQYAEIYLWNSAAGGTIGDKMLRLQSFNIDVSPETENKFQIGEKEAFSVFRKTPVNVTGSFSILDSDLEIVRILSGKADQEYNMITIDEFNSYNQFKVKFYQDEARTIVLSSAMVRNFTVSNESLSISVGGEGAQDFSFEADNFIIAGTGENPNQGN